MLESDCTLKNELILFDIYSYTSLSTLLDQEISKAVQQEYILYKEGAIISIEETAQNTSSRVI